MTVEASCLEPEKFIVLDFSDKPDVIESFRYNENLKKLNQINYSGSAPTDTTNSTYVSDFSAKFRIISLFRGR